MLSVVVPCLDEAGNIPLIESELLPVLDALGDSELIVVDDGSKDGTPDSLERLARPRGGLRLIRHGENRGIGAALRSSLTEARGEWLVFLDADMTFHPSRIPDLIEEQKRTGADCVSGSPFLGGMPGVPASRRLPSLMLNAFYRGLFSRRLTSYTPMFRLYRLSELAELDLRSDGFEVSVEILIKLLRRRRKIVEIPVELTSRQSGASKLRCIRELCRHLRLAASLLFLR